MKKPFSSASPTGSWPCRERALPWTSLGHHGRRHARSAKDKTTSRALFHSSAVECVFSVNLSRSLFLPITPRILEMNSHPLQMAVTAPRGAGLSTRRPVGATRVDETFLLFSDSAPTMSKKTGYRKACRRVVSLFACFSGLKLKLQTQTKWTQNKDTQIARDVPRLQLFL